MHPGPIGVEDPCNPDLNPSSLVIGIGKGFCHTLALVIAGPGPNRVDIAPVGLRLWVHIRISIHLAVETNCQALVPNPKSQNQNSGD